MDLSKKLQIIDNNPQIEKAMDISALINELWLIEKDKPQNLLRVETKEMKLFSNMILNIENYIRDEKTRLFK